MVIKKVKGSMNGKMDLIMKEIGKIMLLMVMGLINGKMGLLMKENGLKGKGVVKER